MEPDPGQSPEDFEREREEYFERIKGTGITAAGNFSHSNYASGDIATWHPAMFRPSKSPKSNPRTTSFLWGLVGGVVVAGIVLGLIIARSFG